MAVFLLLALQLVNAFFQARIFLEGFIQCTTHRGEFLDQPVDLSISVHMQSVPDFLCTMQVFLENLNSYEKARL
ncbi:hypothetical protein KSD_59850 [Ktedonobacter sp. SOSP1-85]|nr:hypothetical protein KSD_59850 [Ktedonobacter sp. SOSP1-85]